MSDNVTIATHLGHAPALAHNRRDPRVVLKEEHIRLDGNFEIWLDRDPKELYQEVFGEALAEFNQKQTRDDRKIEDYYTHIQKDKQRHPLYELIIGVYSKGEKGEIVCSEEDSKVILRAFLKDWEKRNPHLKLCQIAYHADEQSQTQSPHCHIVFAPCATGYARGLQVQSSLTKALNQQGFFSDGRNSTEQMKWEASENQYLGQLCHSRGFYVLHPGEKGTKHLETETFKAVKKLEETRTLSAELEKGIAQKRDELDEITGRAETLRDKVSLQSIASKVMEEKEFSEMVVEYIPAKKKTLTKPAEPEKVVMLADDFQALKRRAQVSIWLKRTLDEIRAEGKRFLDELNRNKKIQELRNIISNLEQEVRSARAESDIARAELEMVASERDEIIDFMDGQTLRSGKTLWQVFCDLFKKERELDYAEQEMHEIGG